MEKCILEIYKKVAFLILNNPEKGNALNSELISDTLQCLKKIQNEKVKIIAITGNGKNFCTGADLSEINLLVNSSYETNLENAKLLSTLYMEIFKCNKITVSIVKGNALGGGCGLALLTDIIMAEKNSKFGFPEVKIGFVPALVSAYLFKKYPPHILQDLMLTGKIISGEEAYKRNIIHILYDHLPTNENIKEFLANIAETISEYSIKEIKQMWQKIMDLPLQQSVKIAEELNAKARLSHPMKIGLNFFIKNKKTPTWNEYE